MTAEKFIIACEVDGETQFVGHDSTSGGHPYWTKWLASSTIYPSFERAKAELAGSDYDPTRLNSYTDGSTSPARMIHSALGLCNDKTTGEGKIQICSVTLTPVETVPIKGELTQPHPTAA
jgi:hypothetical protein